jgi:hypothetical protein
MTKLDVLMGPKLQTFYSCKDESAQCKHMTRYTAREFKVGIKCSISGSILYPPDNSEEDPSIIRTPIDCPLLGQTKEEVEDIRFDKDVLMRNL